MKTIPIALKLHYTSPRLTTAVLCKAIRQDGVVFGFSSVDIDILYAGVLYRAGALGLSISALEANGDLSVPNLTVAGILDSTAITNLDLRAGRWDAAKLEFRSVNYRDIGAGADILGSGSTGVVSTQTLGFTTEYRGQVQKLEQNLLRIVSNQDDAILGSARSGVTLSTYLRTGTIGASPTNRSFTDTARTEADGWWMGGNLTMTSGLSNGLKMEVKRSTAAGAIELVLPLFFGIAAGDTYSITPGSNHLLKLADGTYGGDVKVKYNAVLYFRGFPEVSGLDRISQVGGRTNG